MDKKTAAYRDWQKGMKYREISEKYEVSLSAVKSWAARDWKQKKVAVKKEKICNQPKEKLQLLSDQKQQPKPVGAPKGNKNAVGNKGGGAPKGSKNNYKHGIYEKLYWDSLNEDELELARAMRDRHDEETWLEEQIQLLTFRERRFMNSIAENKNKAGGLALDSITKRNLTVKGNMLAEDGINHSETTTRTVSSFDVIMKLESELTKVQSQKTKCIQALAKLRSDRRKVKEDDNKNIDNELKVQIYLPSNGREKRGDAGE